MQKLITVFLCFIIIGCNAKENMMQNSRFELKSVSFNAVEKQMVIEPDLPEHLENILSMWFRDKVKVNGIEGKITLKISNFEENILTITDGKRLEARLTFNVFIGENSEFQTQSIQGNISSYGEITGDFTLKEFDILVQNTQSDLIIRLSHYLESKI